jgi:hypothetical protein
MLLAAAAGASAQEVKKEISGKVTDGRDHTPMGFASVSMLSPRDSSIITGVYTDDKGRFHLSAPSSTDSLLLKISYLGYQTRILTVHFSADHPDVKLGSLSLKALANTLQTVTIAAEKEKMYAFKKDTVEFNVPEDFMTGGTAMDVLEYTPTLTLDADNNIMVKGKGNVKVYVDNKPIALTGMDVKTFLENTPSFMIEKIQVLKTPPDPEDAAEALAAGITDRYYLNIITRKIRYRGYSTALTGGANSRKELIGRLRFNMNLNPFQLNYFNNLRYNTDSSYTHRTSFLENNDSSVLDQRSYSTRLNFDQYLNGTYEFKFSDKEKLMLNAKAGWNQSKSTGTNLSRIDNPKDIPDQDRIQKSNSTSNGYNISSGADYRKEYDKEGKELRASLDFSQSDSRNRNISVGRYLIKNDTLNQLNEGNSNNMNLRGNIQYRNTFGNEKFYMLNAGINVANRHNLNDVSRSDTASSSPVMYKNNSLSTDYHSALSNYTLLALIGKHDRKLGWVATASISYYLQNGSDHYQLSSSDNRAFVSHNAIGMNYSPGDNQEITVRFNPGFESYTQKTQANDSVPVLTYRYTNFIPGASAKYSFGDHEVSLGYNRDIDPPEWDQMNPYIDNRDPLNIRKGNPELRPTFTNKYHLRYEYNHNALYVALDLSKSIAKDVISSYTTVDSNGVSTRTYVNLDNRMEDNAGLDMGMHYFKDIPSLKGNLNINAEAGLDAYHMHSTDEHVSKDFQNVSGFSSNFKMWSSIRMGFFSLIVNGRYAGPRYFAQGKRPARFSSALRARADMLHQKLNFTLSIENLFGASVKDAYYKTDRYVQYSNNRKDVRYFSIYITYKFRKYNKTGKEDNDG